MSRARKVAVAGLGVAVATGVVTAGRRRWSRPTSPVATSSRVGRSVRLAAIGGKAGGGWAKDRAARVFADADRRVELDEARQLRTAEQVAEALGSMKGALMKLGQMASYLDAGMPEPVREALGQLQQDAPPMSPELAAGVVEAELGSPPDVLFAEWDPVPIAAASIGQVHRAMTKDGRAVAVKVQYPGVDEAIRGDLDNAGLVFGAMTMLFPGLDAKPLVAELRERLIEELDYRREAENQRRFADAYRDHPFIHVPDVLPELSTGRVLTSELVVGARFDELLTWSQAERDLAAEAIYRFVFHSLYGEHMFNGDPHPGNYLFHGGGRVTFLDYGLVKHYTAEELAPFEEMIDAWVLDHDIVRFRKIVERVGLLAPDQPFTDEQVADYFGHFYALVERDEVSTIDPAYASETVRRFFDATGPHGEIMRAANVPPSMAIIQRINLGLYAILGELGATANWRHLANEVWPWVAGPPASALGRAHAAWAAGQRRTRRT